MTSDIRHESPLTARTFRMIRENSSLYLLGLIIAYGLKYHYSVADAEALDWMLSPLARISGFVSGIQFDRELRAGYVNLCYGIRIAPACAGINFMIICFTTLLFPFVHRLQGLAAKLSWLCASIAAAYLATLLTNTLRILISIKLYGASVHGAGITPEMLHRLAGTIIFLIALITIYLVAEEVTTSRLASGSLLIDRKNSLRSHGTLLIPVICYLAVTVVIPLLNGAYGRNSTPAAEHLILVVGSSITVMLIAILIGLLLRKNAKKD